MDCSWQLHGILTFVVDDTSMDLFKDHGKILMATIKLAAVMARALNTTPAKNNWTQRDKYLYKCLSKSIMTKVHDSNNPYLKSINQDGPMYFKYIMMKVASNPSQEAKALEICMTLLRNNLVKQLKSTLNNVKVFNLHMHLQLEKLACYTTTP
jgi:hypothetical protein